MNGDFNVIVPKETGDVLGQQLFGFSGIGVSYAECRFNQKNDVIVFFKISKV